MQSNSKLRIIASVVIVAMAVTMASCSGSKKYGCPNHISTFTLTPSFTR